MELVIEHRTIGATAVLVSNLDGPLAEQFLGIFQIGRVEAEVFAGIRCEPFPKLSERRLGLALPRVTRDRSTPRPQR
jgi:hypothetical protein